MNFRRVVIESLFFYRRTNAAVFAASAVAAAILAGALFVGDSVSYTLSEILKARLGSVAFAAAAGNNFFRFQLADAVGKSLGVSGAPVIALGGTISGGSGAERINTAVVLGVDDRYFALMENASGFQPGWTEGVIINDTAAGRLGVDTGEEVVVRIARPGSMSREISLSPDSDLSAVFRLTVRMVAGREQFGHFSLNADQTEPVNVFLPIGWLSEKIGMAGMANMILLPKASAGNVTIDSAEKALKQNISLDDIGLEVRRLEKQGAFELRSREVFIPQEIGDAALAAGSGACGVLTYFANEIGSGDRKAFYCVVSAIGASDKLWGNFHAELKDDQIALNRWLADDLGANVGDKVTLGYYVPASDNRLTEQSQSFTNVAIIEMDEPVVDGELMPAFGGLADVDNCRDWSPGVPIDLKQIRPKDEQYWNSYKGAPKAFVSLSAGQLLWQNRFGNLTAVRYPAENNSAQAIASDILSSIAPAAAGLYFRDVRSEGQKAAGGSTDFGGLFLGMSIFLIASAMVLLGLVFILGIERRAEQAGILAAIGWRAGKIKRLFICEGLLISLAAAATGVPAGIIYTHVMIGGLNTFWRYNLNSPAIRFHAGAGSTLAAFAVAAALSVTVIFFAAGRQLRHQVHDLLSGNVEWKIQPGPVRKRNFSLWFATGAAVLAAAVVLSAVRGSNKISAGSFFAAGALILSAGLALTMYFIRRIDRGSKGAAVSVAQLGLRNLGRRPGRSLAISAVIACGCFIVIAVGANKQDIAKTADRRDSGTGGFGLFVKTAIPVPYQLNSAEGRKKSGLTGKMSEQTEVMSLRFHDGDQASCLNLNRSQRPGLLGTDYEILAGRSSFSFAKADDTSGSEWLLLGKDYGDDVVPAVGDYSTVYWALGKNLGGIIEYPDEKGRIFRLRIVGIIKNSILQGSLLISRENFVRLFPSDEGYRVFLIDEPHSAGKLPTNELSAALQDYGADVIPSAERLAEFGAVEHIYISIFQMLGGLGLVLGSAGLGLLVLINVSQRRGELAMMRAVGFGKDFLKKMLIYEHIGPVLAGLLCGAVAAAVAVRPVISSGRTAVPYMSIALTVAAIGASGLLWIWISSGFALKGAFIDDLRNE